MKKKVLFTVLAVCIGVLLFGAVSAVAATYGNYIYEVSDGEVTILEVDIDASGELNIPGSIDGCPVTTIAEYAVCGCENLTSVNIPDSVTTIDEGAFYGCSNITSVTLGNSVRKIECWVFGECYSLESVTIPNRVTTIGEGAFEYCESLTDINYLGTEEEWNGISIGLGNDCLLEATIHFNSDDEAADETPSIEYIYKVSGTTATITGVADSSVVTGVVSIPEEINGYTITAIGDFAFQGCEEGMTRVIIPDTVVTIGYGAFMGCRNLTGVKLGNAVVNICDGAFQSCALISVAIPDSVENIGISAFRECCYLNAVTIGNSVTTIGDYAFETCEGLTTVTIGDSVTSIGVEAFRGCLKLTSVNIPESVTSIGLGVFDYCESLTDITVDENNKNYISVDGVLFNKDKTILIKYPAGKTATAYAIPDSVETIGWQAFLLCDSLINVTIPDSVLTVGNGAFEFCRSLTSVKIPDSVLTMEENAFWGCTELVSAIIGNSVTVIGDSAFCWCDSLKDVTIGNSVTNIEFSAFENCIDLTEIIIPDSVTAVGNNAFYNTGIYNDESCFKNGVLYINKYLIEVKDSLDGACVIEDGTRVIADYAFEYQHGLTYVTIPDSVTHIGNSTFYDCDKLAVVHYEGTESEWKKITVGSQNENLSNAIICFTPTETTFNSTDTAYEFSIECDRALEKEMLVVVSYNNDGRVISFDTVECDGGASYTASVPKDTGIGYAKVFLWSDYESFLPLGLAETVNIN